MAGGGTLNCVLEPERDQPVSRFQYGKSIASSQMEFSMAAQYTWSSGPWVHAGTPTLPDASLQDFSFLDVYLVDLTVGGPVLRMLDGYLSNDGICFTRISYASGLRAYIVTSTIPDGVSDQAEFEKIKRTYRNNADSISAVASRDDRFRVSAVDSLWGESLQFLVTNVAEQNDEGPFPLVLPLFDDSYDELLSMGASRLFVRNKNRYQVAVLAAPDPSDGDDAREKLEGKILALVESLVKSLQYRTDSLLLQRNRS